MTTTALGEEGFRWFIGIVEDIANDPRKLGRVKVRILNEDDEDIATEDLEWCQMLMPNTSECVQGVGDTPGLSVGSNVIGFFLDGQEKQLPMILGSYPTIPNLDDAKHAISELARGNNIIVKDPIGPEPASPYATEYPYNRVITTKAGHVIELDDTPNSERVHIYHKTGSYIEIAPDGRVVIKSIKDRFDIVGGDQTVYVKGNAKIDIDGSCDIRTKSDTNITSDAAINLKSSEVTVVGGTLTAEETLRAGDGATGTFTSASGQKIKVRDGIIVSIS